MEAHIQALRINRNPLNLVLGTKRKLGLRIGYMEAALKGFYLNSIETGVHPQKLTRLLSEEFHCVDTESTNGLLQFLTNEGDRVPYQIMLPYLLSSDNITKGQAWEHIEQAGILCSEILRSPEEIDKSFLLGRAMQSEKIEDWDRLLSCYLLLNKHR